MNETMFKQYLIDMKFYTEDIIDILHELKEYGKIYINGVLWEYESGMFICQELLKAFEDMLDKQNNVLEFKAV